MAIGTVLLQPKKVPDAPAPANLALLEDALSLVVRVAWDRAQGGTIVDDLLSGVEAALQRIVEQKQAGIEGALQRLQALMAPVIAELQSLGSGALSDSTAADILAGGATLIHLLSKLAQGLTVEQLRAHLDEVFDILQSDLGLTNTFLDQMVTTLFDDIANRVRQSPAGAGVEVRDNRVQVAQLLRRLKRRLAGQFPFPALNADALAGPLLERMRRSKYEDFVRSAAAVGTALDGSFRVCGTLLDVVPFSYGFNESGPGAAGSGTPQSDQFAWYASWYSGSRLRGDDTDALKNLAFGPVSKDTAEFWAKHSRWIQYGLETNFPAVIHLREGNYVHGVLQMVLSLVDGIIVPAGDEDVPWYANLPIATLFVLLGSLEGRDPFGKHDGLLYPLRMMVKGARKAWWAHATRATRDLFLSILTLANQRSSDSTIPLPDKRLNKNEFVAFSIVCTELLTLAVAAAVPHRWYSVNFDLDTHPTSGLLCAYLLGTAAAVVVGFFSGWLLSWPIAGATGQIRARADWLYFTAPLATFPVYWYFLNENDTDAGKLGYQYPSGAKTVDDVKELTFPGYPNPAASPYNLPFKEGITAECVQGNHGLFSHNAVGKSCQIFAYDFSLAYGTEILAMRDGIVVGAPSPGTTPSTDDPIPDGTEDDSKTSTGANMVTLQHTTVDDQDVDADGNKKTTFARYLHGAQGTIPATVKVTGAVIKKGQVIMKVNSTGVSRVNHVHVDIRPDDGTGNPANYTIPFVFREVDGDGVPTSTHCYKSANVKI